MLEAELDHRKKLERALRAGLDERKRLEEELRRQNDELSRTVRFSEMFVGILGHDLRNPLSAITTAACLLRKRAESEKVSQPAVRILNSATRMGRMIDQLLDFTSIRLGKGIPLDLKRADLTQLCRQAVVELESTGHGRTLSLTVVGSDLAGWWDVERLLQLLSNLLGNAVTHGAPDSPITVTLDGTDAAVVRLSVHNDGVVPPETLPVLFEPFRGDPNEKQEHSHGLGLGLLITQQIVLAHSGTIEVASSESEGTCFAVCLPREGRGPDLASQRPGDQA